jgi:hypothetical protein
MMIAMGLFWLAIILGVVWLARNGVERRQQEAASENALTILDRRFAEGAVSLDEYKQRRDVLTGAAAPFSARAVTPAASSERSWSRADATEGNRARIGSPRKRLKQAESVAVHCR